jgi:DNA-binding XRE family transcriptional regulator
MSKLQEQECFREIGRRLQAFRGIFGLSREQLANEINTPVDTIERIEKGETKSNILFTYMLGLKQDFGLCFNWLISGNGQPFIFQGPKTPAEVYEKYKSAEKTDSSYDVGGVTINDEQLVMDIISLLLFPEARAVLQGQILILKIALKNRLKALKAKKYRWNTGHKEKKAKIKEKPWNRGEIAYET